ncbi:MAG: hypothetical protein NTY04_01570 [Candidatus Staskawiczbacteria bacterium]|nr:hypothetical protein [Candidatus Staskawiczbacteria bacterium]
MEKSFLFSLVGIIIVLAIAFFSQQAFSRGVGNSLISGATDQIKAYVSKGASMAISAIYPKISGEVQKRGEAIKSEVNQQKENIANNISENIGKKISNYFSGISNAIQGKENNNCLPAQSGTVQSSQSSQSSAQTSATSVSQ